MKILIIKLSAIGDVVQALPALEAIKRTYPDSEIDWVVEEAAAGILAGHPLLRKVLVSRRKAWLAMLKDPRRIITGFRDILAFIRELRGTRYDIALDLQGLLKSGIVVGLARARRKVGFDRTRELAYLFLNERMPPYAIERHALERYLDAARHLGASDLTPFCSLHVEQEISAMRRKLEGLGAKGKRLVIVNPVARWKTKLWTEDRFAELADRLIAEQHASVVFTGGREDRPVVDRIRSMMKLAAENWAGETTLRELAALASLSDLFITTDTGPMHLAAAAGAKVFALFGPTAPWRTGPYGNGHLVVRTGIDCSPCFKRRCEDIRCMSGITVANVMERIENAFPH